MKGQHDMEITKTVKLLYGDEKVEKTLVFKEISYETTKDMIIKNHYSHKWNTAFGKVNVGVFNNGELLGVASFGNLMNPKSYKSFNKDFEQENVIELNRLWVDDKLGKNTETILLSASWGIMRELYPHIKVVQSFADGRLGCGTIYKASNFKYYGTEESMFFEHVDTLETYHKVPMENTKRPDGMIKLNAWLVSGKLKPFIVKTYRYAYPLYKNVKIEMNEQRYPLYDKGFEYQEIEYKKQQIIRAFILSTLLDYEQTNILKLWVSKNATEKDIKEALENKSIEMIANERGVQDKLLAFKNDVKSLYTTNVKVTKQYNIFDFMEDGESSGK